MPAITTADGLSAIVEHYDLFLVDQFGVLHDGSAAYPGAVAALHELKAAGKTVILLSNSGRRAASNEARLAALGFDRACYDVCLCSGEVAWRQIAGGQLPVATTAQPLRCLLVNRRGDESAVAGLPLAMVAAADDADFVLLAGSDGDIRPLDDYRALLAPAAARGLPCLCTNPDKVMVLAEGSGFGPGRIADLYAELGGPVTRIGKPFTEIYRVALEEAARLGPLPPPARTIGIGDSIEHDIAGAKRAGFAAALVRTGILSGADPATLAAAMRAHAASPDLYLARFAWSAHRDDA
ncbi:MAG: TIGR01459 family HAD-type hydrolase [Alphaproteobacteria bacterium]